MGLYREDPNMKGPQSESYQMEGLFLGIPARESEQVLFPPIPHTSSLPHKHEERTSRFMDHKVDRADTVKLGGPRISSRTRGCWCNLDHVGVAVAFKLRWGYSIEVVLYPFPD
jgi:hypothetical protein